MNISKQGNPSPNVKIFISAFFVACVTYCQCQTLFADNDSLFRRLPDMLDTATIAIDWGGYVVRPDTDRCVVNYRERLVGPRLTIYTDNGRVGEIETWSHCCEVILRSIRIDSVLTAYSSEHGRYISAVISPTYDPCIETNEITNTDFRHWNIEEIYELKDPVSGKMNQEHSLKDGSGYVTFTDTIFRPQSWTRISYSDGFRHGFTYTMLKFRHADKFKFYSISTYLKGEERGLFLHAEDEKHYVVGHMYLNSDTTGRRRRFIRAFLVDQKGKATHYREYFESADVPSFEKLSTVKKVPLCDPKSIVRCLFPDADPHDYPETWGYGSKFLKCRDR